MAFVDHYAILGVPPPPPGEEGLSSLTEEEIRRAYRAKALLLHPDKRPSDDPAAAHSDFQKLKESYQTLMDVNARNLFHNLFHARRNQQQQQNANNHDPKRRKMMADLQERERRHAHNHDDDDDDRVRREEERRIAQKLKREIASIRETMVAQARTRTRTRTRPDLDRARVLKVTWEENNGGHTYTADRLRQLFGEFGEVDDVLIRNKNKNKKKKKDDSGRPRPRDCCSALVVMASKDSAVAACWSVLGDVSNPLMVQPLDDSTPPPPPPANHTKFEESVLTKLKQAAAASRQKGNVVM